MARRRRSRRSSKSNGLVVDFTEMKLGSQLLVSYNGPRTIDALRDRDYGGALEEYGSGSIGTTLINSLLAGGGARIRRSIGAYVKPINSKWLRVRM